MKPARRHATPVGALTTAVLLGTLLALAPINAPPASAAPGDITTIAGGVGGPMPAINTGQAPSGLAISGTNLYVADGTVVRRIDLTTGTETAIAGTGVAGYSGDGGPALAAQLSGSDALAADPAGNVYVADANNNRVRRIDTGGTITTVAGNGSKPYSGDGPATSVGLSPSGLAVSGSTLFIADSYNNRVRAVTAGTISTVAGTGTYGNTGDNGPATAATLAPYDIAVNTAGNVVVAAGDRIRTFTPGGTITLTATVPNVYGPIAVDASDNIYYSGFNTNTVSEIILGVPVTVAGTGTAGFSGDGGPATSATLRNPSGLAVTATGTLYVADTGNERLRAVTSGTITTYAGTGSSASNATGIPALAAQMGSGITMRPTGDVATFDGASIQTFTVGGLVTDVRPVATAAMSTPSLSTDAAGNIYSNPVNGLLTGTVKTTPAGVSAKLSPLWGYDIAAAANGAVFLLYNSHGTTRMDRVNPDGSAVSIWAGYNSFYQLGRSVAVGPDGNVYVSWACEILRMTPDGAAVTRVAGQTPNLGNTCGFGGDGSPAINATIQDGDLALDTVGSIYLASPGRIRRIDPAGTITTIGGTGNTGFSGDGGPATSADVDPTQITVDPNRNVYFTNGVGSRVRKIETPPLPDLPGAPTGVTGQAQNGQVPVSWLAPAWNGGTSITGYTVTASPGGATCSWTTGPLTCVVGGLTNGTPYTFTVTATNTNGTGSPSAPSAPMTPGKPSPPTNATAVAGSQSATVTWTAPASDGGVPITSYTVVANPGGTTCTWTTGPLSCTVTGLTNGTAYTFSVVATNAVTNSDPSTPSAAVTPAAPPTPPGAPSGVTASPGALYAVVQWNPSAANGGFAITGYTVTASPGGHTCSWTPVNGALLCYVVGLDAGVAHTFTVTATNALGTSPPSTPSAPATPTAAGPGYHPVTPQRVLDSRTDTGGWSSTKLGPNQSRTLHVAGVNGVPASATAVVLNVTVTGGTAGSYLTAYPAGDPVPTAASLNFVAGQTIPNLVSVKIGTNGDVSLFNKAGSVHVIADLAGWYDDGTLGSGQDTQPFAPIRILDSRDAGSPWGDSPLGPGETRTLHTPYTPGDSIVVNVTATGGTAASFLTLAPAGESLPNAANVLFGAGQTTSNLAIVKVGANGDIAVFNQKGAVDVVIDQSGATHTFLSTFRFHPLAPTRVLDSRNGTGGYTTPWGPTTARSVLAAGTLGIPADAKAVLVNITGTQTTASTFVTAYDDGPPPLAANLLIGPGQTKPTLALVPLAGDGTFTLYNANGSVHLIADVVGYVTWT